MNNYLREPKGSLYFLYMKSLQNFLKNIDKASILFVGDSMNNMSQREYAEQPNGEFDYSGYFDKISGYIKSKDYSVVNLETPIHNRQYQQDKPFPPIFSTDPGYIKELKNAGFKMCTTANNHALDQGSGGVIDTINYLNGLGFDHMGIYNNYIDKQHRQGLVKNINGINVGFINYTYKSRDPKPEDNKGYNIVVNYIDLDHMRSEIEVIKNKGAEFIVCCAHTGVEHTSTPSQKQKELFNNILDLGVDAVIGTHSHTIQPIELKNGKLIAWSLGNFVSGMKINHKGLKDVHGGLMLIIDLYKDILGVVKIKKARYKLTFNDPANGFRVDWVDNVDKKDAKSFAEKARRFLKNRCINVEEERS